jgi:hypothetical protein
MNKDRLLVELAKKNRDAFRDAKVSQATIDVKWIQIVLKRINHFSYAITSRFGLAKIVPKEWKPVFTVISKGYRFAAKGVSEGV